MHSKFSWVILRISLPSCYLALLFVGRDLHRHLLNGSVSELIILPEWIKIFLNESRLHWERARVKAESHSRRVLLRYGKGMGTGKLWLHSNVNVPNVLSEMFAPGAGSIAQWWSAWLACIRPSVRSLCHKFFLLLHYVNFFRASTQTYILASLYHI